MANRTTGHRALFTAIAYAIGAAIASVIFWLVGRRRPPPPAPLPLQVGPSEAPPTYEPKDANPRAIVVAGVIFLVSLAAVIVVSTLLFFVMTGTGPVLTLPPPGHVISSAPPTPVPPPPQLETQAGQTQIPFTAEEERALQSYAWIDKAQGTVRLPIDRAMDLIIANGLPARPPTQAASYADQGLTAPSAASSGRASEERYP